MTTADLTQKVDQLLKSAQLRQTKQRESILQVLLSSSKPLTQNQIAARLRDKTPNKVTIYRVLEKLIKSCLVHKAFLRKRTWHFELAHNCSEEQCHPHFTCTDCGDTHCLTEFTVPMAKSEHKGFAIQHQRVQLEGLCPDCSLKTRKA
ncbi:Fur family transcriptional regulator [Planctomycetota bacterium]